MRCRLLRGGLLALQRRHVGHAGAPSGRPGLHALTQGATGYAGARALNPATPSILLQVGWIGVLGMGVGRSLCCWRCGTAPWAWLGAALTVLGTAMVLLR